MKRKYKIAAVDFDGVLYNDGNIIPGSKEALLWMREHGYKIILWTCRAGNRLTNAKNILKISGMLDLFDAINENVQPVKYKTSAKIIASVFIDDRNVGGFPGWKRVIEILEGENENKRGKRCTASMEPKFKI